jgi:WD40 repeat protein
LLGLGIAWNRTSKAGKEYISVKLDSPTWPAPINAALFADKNGRSRLVWDRDERRSGDAAAAKEIAVLRGHKRPVNSTAFSPDGACIVATSEESTYFAEICPIPKQSVPPHRA